MHRLDVNKIPLKLFFLEVTYLKLEIVHKGEKRMQNIKIVF